MTRKTKIALIAATATLLLAGATVARAQEAGLVRAAKAAGTVGEKADGYLGIAGAAAGDVRARVDEINIKRRAAYTAEAAKRGVTLDEWAAAIGCRTLSERVADGQAYALADGQWRKKSGPIALPATCG